MRRTVMQDRSGAPVSGATLHTYYLRCTDLSHARQEYRIPSFTRDLDRNTLVGGRPPVAYVARVAGSD